MMSLVKMLNLNDQQNVIFSNGELELGHPALPKNFEFSKGTIKRYRRKLQLLCNEYYGRKTS